MQKNNKRSNRIIGFSVIAVTVIAIILCRVASNLSDDSNLPTDIFGEVISESSFVQDSDDNDNDDVSDDGNSSEALDSTTSTAAQTSVSSTSSQTQQSTTDDGSSEENTYAYAYAGFNPAIADLNVSDWTLTLVNRDYILPDGYTADLAVTVPGSGVQLDSRVAPHYVEMYNAAKEDGITLTPLSGYRRISTQKRNFENKISFYQNQGYSKAQATQLAATIILPPGTSEHNAGLAMDICSLDVSFETSAEFEWLSENAEDYGFILRYPQDKTDITKITYEPWHWRYVGIAHAKEINARGVCLEEYLGQ